MRMHHHFHGPRFPFFADAPCEHDTAYHAAHRGGHHGGRFSRFEDDDGMGGGRHGRRPGRRVFAHGELKLVLLALVAEQPRHGYELIRTIEEMFDGAYAPSPGAVYPTLTLLEEMELAHVEIGEGGKKCYHITDAGRAYLEENRAAVDAAMARMEQTAKMFARMAAPMAIREAMHTLRHALRHHVGAWTPSEAKRVLGIIKRAARDIAQPGED